MIGEVLLGSAAIVAAVGLLAPSREVLRRLAGYQVPVDLTVSGYVVAAYSGSGMTGLTMAMVGAVGISLALRAVGRLWGRSRYQYKGSTSLAAGAAAALTQGMRWLRSSFSALFKGGKVEAPAPLNGGWVDYYPAPF